MSKKLVLFDFDGTLTYKDSFLEFIKYYRGKYSFYKGLLWLSPILVAYKVKIIPNYKAKQYVLAHFFKGEDKDEFIKKGTAFATSVIPRMLIPNALSKLRSHVEEGDRVIVVSASADAWVQAWCKQEGIEFVGSRLEVKDGKITGNLHGYNCYGLEKVNRLKAHLDLNSYSQVIVYGDSRGDREMLQLGTERYFKFFS